MKSGSITGVRSAEAPVPLLSTDTSVEGRSYGDFTRRIIRQAGLVAALGIMLGVFGGFHPSFIAGSNLENILTQSAAIALLAVGETYVIVTAGIDLSIGSTLALSAVSGALVSKVAPSGVALLAALAIGGAAGLANGGIVVVTGITPFIVTLGTMSIYSGLALIIANGETVYGLPQGIQSLMAGKLGPVPVPIVIMVGIGVVGATALRHTRFGEYVLAIGGSVEVARLAGIFTRRYTIGAYVVCGLLAGLGGMVLVGQLGAADPTLGGDLLLTAIAASVMGGASLMGGEGSIVGAVLGALVLQMLTSGLTSMNVQAFYQNVAVGCVIILALLLDRLIKGSGS